ncbi:MAG: S1C family serine protease [Kiloniellales bacterium]|nr:S1C family serine protease [Kiloniellales bacterium]
MNARSGPAARDALQIALAALLSLILAGPFTSPAAANPLDAIVGVRAEIPPDARTAEVLGTEREGSGVVIDADGLVLTIGYLIMESSSAEIVLRDDRRVPAEVVAYDYDSGFGLLRPLAPLGLAPIELGESDDLRPESQVLVASHEIRDKPTPAYVMSRRDFAGYWEYLMPNAIFTAPPHPGFGGAALIGPDGRLLGIGSLYVGDAAIENRPLPGNMFVPIEALTPILDELKDKGRASSARPWLGVYAEEHRGHLFVNRVAPEGPAAAAGLQADDVIVAVDGRKVSGLADFYRKLWALGDAGVTVPLTVLTRDGMTEIPVGSGDRYDYLRLEPSL